MPNDPGQRPNWKLPLSKLLGGLMVGVLALLAGCDLLNRNDFIPPPPPSTVAAATISAIRTSQAATAVLLPTNTPLPTATRQKPSPTLPATAAPSSTPTPAFSPTPTFTPTPTAVYIRQPGGPVYLPNFARPNDGCNWIGVAGQVFDENDVPVNGLLVEVSGRINDASVLYLAVSGSAPIYGPGGYEVTLGETPFESVGALTITLFDLNGKKLSEQAGFATYADCSRNLALVNFYASSNLGNQIFLPAVQR